MADEAFALSPISARAAQPSEADYDAIREAFMETARGRWFLSEYGKRNRNADTTMVLDAVARIEQGIAAQKQPVPTGLLESIGAIGAMVDEASHAAAHAVDAAHRHPSFSAAREGARIVREVAWTLRECGADIRICDLLDAQVAAIDAGHQQIADAAHRNAVLAAFDLLMQRIGSLADDEKPVRSDVVSPPCDASAELAAMPPEPAPGSAIHAPEAAEPAQAQAASVAVDLEPGSAEAQIETYHAASSDAAVEHDPDRAPIDAAHDDAVLDLIAMEMEMEQPDLPDPDTDRSVSTASDSTSIDGHDLDVMRAPERSQAAINPSADAAAQDVGRLAATASAAASGIAMSVDKTSTPPSLGAALIANGMVPRPLVNGPDPLAPIRRMSQAERIAFFS